MEEVTRFVFYASRSTPVPGTTLIQLFNRQTPRDRPFVSKAVALEQAYRLELEVEIPAQFRQPHKSAWLRFSLQLKNQPGNLLVILGATYNELVLVSEPWELAHRRDHIERTERDKEFKTFLQEAVVRFMQDCGIRVKQIQ